MRLLLAGAAATLASADVDVMMQQMSALERAAELKSKGHIDGPMFNRIQEKLMEYVDDAPVDARRGLQQQGDVPAKCLADILSDNDNVSTDCLADFSALSSPAVNSLVQYLVQNTPVTPPCPDVVGDGTSMKPPCGAVAPFWYEMDVEINCMNEYPYNAAGSGCTAECNNGPSYFQFYCPPDNDVPMRPMEVVVPDWAAGQGYNSDDWRPTCNGEQVNCQEWHPGYMPANDEMALVMCYIAKPGFYVDPDMIVQPCANSCLECWGPTLARCTACWDGSYLTTNLSGNAPDADQQYLHNGASEGDFDYAECLPCDESCHTCDGPGPENCIDRQCQEDFCQQENYVLKENWREIMCHRDECEEEGGEAAEAICCEERVPCDENACNWPLYRLFEDGSWQNIRCRGSECDPTYDNDTCCELNQEVCNADACKVGFRLRENYESLTCTGYPCDKEVDNDVCCLMGAWLDYSNEQMTKQGKSMWQQHGSDWDSARYTEWLMTAKLDVTLYIDQYGSYMMGPCRRTGIGYWSHMHSGGWDAHPDGWAFYSDSGPYDWYGGASWSHVDGCCYGWGTGDFVRVEVDLDERWAKWYITRPGSLENRHWGTATNIDINGGVALCVSFHDHQMRSTIVDHTEALKEENMSGSGNADLYRDACSNQNICDQLEKKAYNGMFLDWGGDGNEQYLVDMEEGRRTIRHWSHGAWKSFRTSLWQNFGAAAITYRIDNYYNDQMMGVIRGDYIMYENHMHSGSQGDHHPDGWNWYNAGMGFHNYDPWGANFYHDRGDIGGYQTGDSLRVELDLTGNRQIAIWITSEARGYDDVRVCRWTDIDIGRKGVAFGGSLYDGENSGVAAQLTIIEWYYSDNIPYQDAADDQIINFPENQDDN